MSNRSNIISVNGIITLNDIDELYESLIEVNVPNTWDSWEEYQSHLNADYEEVMSTNNGWTEYADECPWA